MRHRVAINGATHARGLMISCVSASYMVVRYLKEAYKLLAQIQKQVQH